MVCDYYTKLRLPFLNVLPENWRFVKIGELFAESKINNREDLPLLSVTRGRGIIPQSESEKRDISSSDKSKYKVIEPGDIVYNTMRMWQGVVSLSNGEGIVSPAYTVLKPKRALNGKFVEYLFKTSSMIRLFRRFSQGLVDDTLNLKYENIKDILMPLPPLAEQQKIVEILSSVDDAIEKTEAIINQTETVKEGLMQQLLTKGIGHIEFNETEIGEIPSTWEIVSLGDIIKNLKAGVSVNSESRRTNKSELGILKTSSVSERVFNPEEHKAILPEEYTRAMVNPKEDHIIISRMNTPLLVGSSSYIDKDYPNLFLPDRLWQATIAHERANPLWLSFVLTWTYMRDKIGGIATGTSGSMKNISKQAFLTLNICLPPLAEQKKIAGFLQSLDNRILAEKDQVKMLRNLKTGLMKSLLTGRGRANVDQSEEVLV
ncbi:restriction endonuclease subunit S [Paenibacillus sp. FSL R5-0345]|uniref:restriction endonuclease subunit S n=1 Tax=Paenibacillus sp. FSL R5-0345 TaxID=1536770 RepID=UPI0006939080|nr:restriction endonuclease subunit S [Paenibacillus sp. FSL R5-0345]